MNIDPTIVVGILTLIGTIITVIVGFISTRDKVLTEINKNNAVQDERIAELTREVRRHNSFAERIPSLEAKYDTLDKRVSRLESDK